jgi:hypothetical protein
MVMRYLVIIAAAALLIGGCSAAGPMTPESENPSGWVIEWGTSSEREAHSYFNVTSYAIPAIKVTINSFVPMQSLGLTLSLTNTTSYTPRNLCIAFECPVEDPDGMTDRGSPVPWDYMLFNEGLPLEFGNEYVIDVVLDISETGIGFDYYVMGLFGSDPHNEKFVYENSNDWYSMGNNDIMLGELNGANVDTGLDGKWPMISGNGKYIAAVKDPSGEAYFVIKNTITQQVSEIHITIPGVPGCAAAWGVFSYDGRYFVYAGGAPPYRSYLYLRDMDTGETTLIEGAADGTEICAAFGMDISGDGSMISYAFNDEPTSAYSYANIKTYNVATGEKIQLTDNDNEECDTSLNFRGDRLSYRRGYMILWDDIHGGQAVVNNKMDSFIKFRHGEMPYEKSGRTAQTSYVTVYELRAVDLVTSSDNVIADYVESPPNYIKDARMDWAGNFIVYRDQPDQIYSTYTTVYAAAFDGLEIFQMTNDSSYYKMVPFISGDSLYGGWDVLYGTGVWATDRVSTWKAVDVGMWPDNGV